MILILSKHYEASTNDVIDWLYAKKVPFIRLNCEDLYFKENDFYIHISKENTTKSQIIDNIKAVWLRKWFHLELNFDT